MALGKTTYSTVTLRIATLSIKLLRIKTLIKMTSTFSILSLGIMTLM